MLAAGFFAVVAVFFAVLVLAAVVPDLAAFSREAWVTPVALAMSLSWVWVNSFSPRSALLMSDAVTPSTFFASCSWVRPAPVRASLISAPTLFAMAAASLFRHPDRPAWAFRFAFTSLS